MESKNFTCGTSLEDSVGTSIGIITFNFTWIGFANVQGDSIRVGDAFDGFLLPYGTTLIFKVPDEWKISEIKPNADFENEYEIGWLGYRSFDKGQPSFVLYIPPSWFLAVFVLIGLGIVPILLYYLMTREKPIDSNQLLILKLIDQNDNFIYQRDLVKKTEWSNAKVSLIIDEMVKNNMITKEKKGRMNVIHLNKKI
jgi:hypothetical protein